MALAVPLKPLRVAAYCRVSTDTAEQLSSQENQVAYFTEKITDAGHVFAGVYPDEGISGTTMTKRKAFLRMMQDAGLEYRCVNPEEQTKSLRSYQFVPTKDEPKFDWIWCKNTSRFARNIEVVDAINKLTAKGVHVLFDQGNLSTDKDMFTIQLLLTLDQQESRDKGEKVRWGHKRGAERGKMHTSGKLYGYSYDSKKKTLTPKPEEAEVVRLMFQLYSEGKGIRVILNQLKEQGHRTREGKDFSKSSVARILDNAKYCGTLVRNRWETGRVFVDKHSPRMRAESEWETHEDHEKIEPIITKELFQACQEIRGGKVNTQNQKGIYKGHSEYAGLIVCGKCGSSYTKNQDRGRVFYNCSKKKREGVLACDNPNVALYQIEQFVKYTGLFNFTETVVKHRDERIHQLWLKKESILSRKDTDKEQAVAGLVAEAEAIEQGLKRLNGQLFKGNISDAEFEEIRAEKAQVRQALLNQIEELRKDNDQLDADARAIEAQIERLNEIDPEQMEMWPIVRIRSEIKRIIVERIPEGWFEPVLKVEYKVMDLIDEYAKEKAQ